MENIGSSYLMSVRKLFRYYRSLGEGAMAQLNDNDLFWHADEESNSIANIVKHIAGNSLSRWTDFMESDGEKEWRNRDDEFVDTIFSKEELMALWNRGWECLFAAIDHLSESDLMSIVYIRNEGHTVTEAINRQLAHLPYHVGQIVFIAKMISRKDWSSLSIPKNQSRNYNQNKFSGERDRKFFTDDV